MIGKLRGIVDATQEDSAIIDVGGVGYLVFASARTLDNLRLQSGETSLYIETHVREDHIHLYGFISPLEKDWFNLLMTVQGVGAKVALAIQSVFSGEELTTIIAAQDKTALTQVKGIGKKVAERLSTELKDKVTSLPTLSAEEMGLKHSGGTLTPTSHQNTASNSARDEAISALVNLGYAKIDAFSAVSRVLQEDAALELPDVIRLGLRELG